MALSMDEQRVLAEIERRLTAEDPSLAACMTNFRRPGPAAVLRSPRGRIIGSLFTVLLVAMISLMVYAMIPFRGHATRTPASPAGVPPANQTQITATGAGSPASRGAARTMASGGTSGKTATAAAATGNHTTAGGGTSGTAHSAKPRTTSPSHPGQARARSSGS
jgi:Protein of unknown function (DUF3040)